MPNQTLDPVVIQPVATKIPGDPGPAKWLAPFLEARYTAISKRPGAAALKKLEADLQVLQDAAIRRFLDASGLTGDEKASTAIPATTPVDKVPDGRGARPFASILQPGRGEEVFAKVKPDYWYQLTRQYRQRQAQARKQTKAKKKKVSFHTPVPLSPRNPGRQ